MYHLFPSSSFLPSFFVLMLSGFGFVPGPLLLWLLKLSELFVLSGTAPLALKPGFLCVIWLLSTFLSPAVTDSPLFNASKTAPISPDLGFGGAGKASNVGMGGGGGGGGGPPAPPGGGGGGAGAPLTAGVSSLDFKASARSTPLLFHWIPDA